MALIGRLAASAFSLGVALSVGWSVPAAAKTPDEYADEWTEARRGDRDWKQRAVEQLTMGPMDRLFGPESDETMKVIINQVITKVEAMYRERRDPCLAAAVNMAHYQVVLTTGRQEIIRGATDMFFSAAGGAAGGRNLADFLGQRLADQIKDKLQDQALDSFKKKMSDEFKKGLPQYFEDDDRRGDCDIEFRIVWEKAAERYQFLVAGDCKCSQVSCGQQGGAVPLRRWAIEGSGTVIPRIEQLANGDKKVTFEVGLVRDVSVTADCCGQNEHRFRTHPANGAGNEWVGFIRQPQRQPDRQQTGVSPPPAGGTGAQSTGGTATTTQPPSGPPRRQIDIPEVPDRPMTQEELERLGEQAQAASDRARAAHSEASTYLDMLKKRQPPPTKAEIRDAEAAVEEAGQNAQRARTAVEKVMEKFNQLEQQQQQQEQTSVPSDRDMQVILDEHNKARAAVGSPPLRWDPALAAGAAAYAQQLTTLGRVHAPREGRKNIRENLLQGLRGDRSPREMVGVWIDEKRYFRPGIFPDVSITGNWAQVGHYTQIIWPTTTHLGCAVHSDRRYDWTVCRYSPPGNQDGKPILVNNARSSPSTTPATPEPAD